MAIAMKPASNIEVNTKATLEEIAEGIKTLGIKELKKVKVKKGQIKLKKQNFVGDQTIDMYIGDTGKKRTGTIAIVGYVEIVTKLKNFFPKLK